MIQSISLTFNFRTLSPDNFNCSISVAHFRSNFVLVSMTLINSIQIESSRRFKSGLFSRPNDSYQSMMESYLDTIPLLNDLGVGLHHFIQRSICHQQLHSPISKLHKVRFFKYQLESIVSSLYDYQECATFKASTQLYHHFLSQETFVSASHHLFFIFTIIDTINVKEFFVRKQNS